MNCPKIPREIVPLKIALLAYLCSSSQIPYETHLNIMYLQIMSSSDSESKSGAEESKSGGSRSKSPKASSTSTMYLTSTISVPNNDEIILSVSTVLQCQMLNVSSET